MSSIGQILGKRYELVRLIGQGGMGVVFEARDLKLERRVAVKLLRGEFVHKESTKKRFVREARAAGYIGHDNVCEVTDLGETPDGSPFLVMPLLVGTSLSSVIKSEGALKLERVYDIAKQVLDALVTAHHSGVVHRDLKPANIFLATLGDRRDFVKILDFGISKFAVSTENKEFLDSLTQTGTTLGTPHYMSPEQARGEKNLDCRVDLYSFGVILYEMITGCRPFDANSANELLWKVWNEPVSPPRVYRPDLSTRIEDVVLRAMARDPQERFHSAEALREEWAEAFESARDVSSSELITPPTQEFDDVSQTVLEGNQQVFASTSKLSTLSRRRYTIGAAALGVVVIVGALFHSSYRQPQAEMSSIITSAPTLSDYLSDREIKIGHRSRDSVLSLRQGDADLTDANTMDAQSFDETSPEMVRILLDGVPDGAQITVDGRVIDKPIFDVVASQGEVPVLVEHNGYQSWKKVVKTSYPQTIFVQLKATRQVEVRRVIKNKKKQDARMMRKIGSRGSDDQGLTPFGVVP